MAVKEHDVETTNKTIKSSEVMLKLRRNISVYIQYNWVNNSSNDTIKCE